MNGEGIFGIRELLYYKTGHAMSGYSHNTIINQLAASGKTTYRCIGIPMRPDAMISGRIEFAFHGIT